MAVRRKSNWYIYFIAFGVALAFAVGVIFTFSWYLFPEAKEASGLTSGGDLDDNFKPDASHNFSVITMLKDGEHTSPELFMLTAFNAVENRIVFIPIPNGISVKSEERTLSNVYAAKGGEGVVSAVKNIIGIAADGYICLDRQSFIDFASGFGNVEYNVPKTLIVNDGTEIDTFNAGEQIFSAESIFRYIYLADFGEDIDYRYNMICDVICEMFNQNIKYVDSSLLDTCYKLLTDGTENNVNEKLYNSKKAGMLNTAIYGSSPSEYYIPYGEYGADGSFAISENSVISITQKCGGDTE